MMDSDIAKQRQDSAIGPFANVEELRAFIREEVRKALGEELRRQAYRPRNMEYKDKEREDMPDWARW